MRMNGIDEALIRDHINLAYWETYKLLRAGWFGKHELEDMKQEAILALMKAAADYDPERRTVFSTMVVVYVRNRLQTIVAKQKRPIRGGDVKTYSIDANVWRASSTDGEERTNVANYVPADADTESEVLGAETAETLAKLVLQILKERDGTWFLQCAAGKTMQSIAEEYGVSKQAVSVSIKRNRAKLQAELRRRGLYE